MFGVAGLLFGFSATAAYHLVEGLEWLPVRTLSLTLILGWLVVPTVISVGVVGRRARAVLWGVFLALALVLPVVGGTSVVDSFVLLLVVVAGPSLFVVATGVRSMRGAAWLVAPALTAAGLSVVLVYPALVYLYVGVPFDPFVWWLLGGAAAAVAAVPTFGWVMATLYEHKWVSDETLLVLQWWFVLAITQSLLLGTQGAAGALLGMAPFVVMVGFLLLSGALLRPSTTTPVRLLLLRTFGARRRSSRLLRDLTMHWRWVGSVELITGPDLASEVLEPHELIEFLRGRLSRLFVRTEADLDRRVHDLDLRPDRDGRYRVNDLLCHDDTWRQAVQALVGSVDAVLVDLRGLTAQHLGVVHELERLVALIPLDRVVGLTDASTDEAVVRWALDRASYLSPSSSPVRSDPHPALRVVRLEGRRAHDLRQVLDAVAGAADRSASRRLRGDEVLREPVEAVVPALIVARGLVRRRGSRCASR